MFSWYSGGDPPEQMDRGLCLLRVSFQPSTAGLPCEATNLAGHWMTIGHRPPTKTGHWKATGRILGNFLWKILYKNLDLKGGGTGSGYPPRTLYPPL